VSPARGAAGPPALAGARLPWETRGYDPSAMSRPGGTSRESGQAYVNEDLLLSVLDEAMAALRSADVPFLVMGGIASGVFGRHRSTRDIDVFVRLHDADRSLDSLDDAGFETSIVYPHWLSKAFKDEVTVDVISRSTPDILMDDEMLERVVIAEYKGRKVPLVPAEDLFVMKTLAASEDTPRYWYDALGIIGHTDLDWDYLIRRARASGPRRVLAALLYAQSNDLVVPIEPVRTLFDLVTGSRPSAEGDRSAA
jgi:predicted nucleotidyltransferase